MRYTIEHKQETRERILDAAARLFRREGYGGSGIGPLTKEAGVTNGAFYGHFKSKSEAFRAVVLSGMVQLKEAIAMLKAERGARWRVPFISFYLGQRRTCELGESCALASLSPEVMRADDETREAYEQSLSTIIDEVASGLSDLPGNDHDDRAIALLSLLAGGVTLARAVRDPAVSERIANAVARYATALTSADGEACKSRDENKRSL